MATKYHFGLDAELRAKMDAKFNPQEAQQALNWIAQLAGMHLGNDFHAGLKDGVALCKAAQTISPGSCGKINMGKMPFVQRENIVSFLAFCKGFGLKEHDVFVTQDLFEGDNLGVVVDSIFALGGVCAARNLRNIPPLGARRAIGGQVKHHVVHSAGAAGVLSRQNQGSYGYQDDSVQKSLRGQIVKSEMTPSEVPSKLFGFHNETDKGTKMDQIIRNPEMFQANRGGASLSSSSSYSPAPAVNAARRPSLSATLGVVQASFAGPKPPSGPPPRSSVIQAGSAAAGPKFCPECGKPAAGGKFCTNCGNQMC